MTVGKRLLVVFSQLVLWLFVLGCRGNAKKYAIENVRPLAESPLNGKTLLWLGSSVTVGAMAGKASLADYIGVRNSCHTIKEAVNGSTLADTDSISYISRLKKIDRKLRPDAVIVQLSANDAIFGSRLGSVSSSRNIACFDTATSAGGMEYIISYIRSTWDCPVIFYTVTKFSNQKYQALVNILLELRQKWGIGVADLWNDTQINSISPQERKLYLADGSIHPTRAGYLLWWTPRCEQSLYSLI